MSPLADIFRLHPSKDTAAHLPTLRFFMEKQSHTLREDPERARRIFLRIHYTELDWTKFHPGEPSCFASLHEEIRNAADDCIVDLNGQEPFGEDQEMHQRTLYITRCSHARAEYKLRKGFDAESLALGEQAYDDLRDTHHFLDEYFNNGKRLAFLDSAANIAMDLGQRFEDSMWLWTAHTDFGMVAERDVEIGIRKGPRSQKLAQILYTKSAAAALWMNDRENAIPDPECDRAAYESGKKALACTPVPSKYAWPAREVTHEAATRIVAENPERTEELDGYLKQYGLSLSEQPSPL